MTTIRRNTKKAKAIIEAMTGVRTYSLGNDFEGSDFLEGAKAWIQNKLSSGAKLSHSHGDFYTVSVHSNLWYEFESEGK